jgi:hypothetical protein
MAVALFGRNENHGGGQHVVGELGVVTSSAVDKLVFGSQFFGCFLDESDQVLIEVDGIPLPSHFNFASASCPFSFRQALNDSQNLCPYFRIFMTYVDGEVDHIGNDGMNVGMADDFTGGVYQLRPTQLVDFFVEIAQSLSCRKEGILPFVHRGGSGMVGLAEEPDPVVEHTQVRR